MVPCWYKQIGVSKFLLEIHSDKSKITIKEINDAFTRVALKVHPDKSCDDKEERTVGLVKLKAAYEKLKDFGLIDSTPGDPEDEVDLFLKDNFDKFNFPFENKGNFTIKIEDWHWIQTKSTKKRGRH